jgi:hypothetical protein
VALHPFDQTQNTEIRWPIIWPAIVVFLRQFCWVGKKIFTGSGTMHPLFSKLFTGLFYVI